MGGEVHVRSPIEVIARHIGYAALSIKKETIIVSYNIDITNAECD